jgi:phosphoglycolate phosphatase
MPVPAYIFDLDGTLVDSRHDLATAVNLMRRDLGLPGLSLETVVGFVGDGMRRLVERALRAAPASTADVDQAIALLRGHYSEHLLDQTVLYPGVLASLEALSRHPGHLAIVTNKPTEPARRICAGLGILRFFPQLLGGDACAKIKPDPTPLLQVLNATGADPAFSWMIGDHSTDLEAGRRAGLRRCFCRFGFGRAGTEVAELSVDSLTEFADHVLRRPVAPA